MGRRVYTVEEIQKLKNLISLYREQVGNRRIVYREMFRFNQNSYNDGLYPEIHSDDFWRKDPYLGKKLVDDNNSLFSKSYIEVLNEKITVTNIEYIVNSSNNKEEIIDRLSPLIKALEKSLIKEKEYNEKFNQAKQEIRDLKEKQLASKQKIVDYEKLLFQTFRYSMDNRQHILQKDLLSPKNNENIGNDIVLKSFEKLFESPDYLFKIIYDNNESKSNQKEVFPVNNNKIKSLADFKEKKNEKSAFEDFGFDEIE